MALFYQKGTISDMSEVQSGTTQSGREWQRMSLILDIPGFQGSIYKMVFQVSGDHVKEVSLYNRGDKVQIGFSIYAREWNGKWYNNVDLVNITDESGAKPAPAPQEQESNNGRPPLEEITEYDVCDRFFREKNCDFRLGSYGEKCRLAMKSAGYKPKPESLNPADHQEDLPF